MVLTQINLDLWYDIYMVLKTLLVQMKECISFEDTSNNSVTFFNGYSTCPLTIELIHEKILK